STRPELHSSVAVAPNGQFAIAWQKNFTWPDSDIQVRRFSEVGISLGTQKLDLSSRQDPNPSLAMDPHGKMGVVYQAGIDDSYDILARRISSTGTLSGTITVRSTPTWHEMHPVVALHPTNGSFVVAYDVQATEDAITTFVGLTEVSADNTWASDF